MMSMSYKKITRFYSKQVSEVSEKKKELKINWLSISAIIILILSSNNYHKSSSVLLKCSIKIILNK